MLSGVTLLIVPLSAFTSNSPPPFGWSYIFTRAWEDILYDEKRPAGIEDGAIWIECAPDELRQHHLPQLEKAVAQANATYRSTEHQKAIAQRRQKELDSQTQAQLHELGASLSSNTNSTQTKRNAKSGSNLFKRFLGWLFGLLESKR